jgi:hypothetical protein
MVGLSGAMVRRRTGDRDMTTTTTRGHVIYRDGDRATAIVVSAHSGPTWPIAYRQGSRHPWPGEIVYLWSDVGVMTVIAPRENAVWATPEQKAQIREGLALD